MCHQSADCMNAGMRSFESLKARLNEILPGGWTFDSPKFHFNNRLNTCLMQVEYWSVLSKTRTAIDVYENKALLESSDYRNRSRNANHRRPRLVRSLRWESKDPDAGVRRTDALQEAELHPPRDPRLKPLKLEPAFVSSRKSHPGHLSKKSATMVRILSMIFSTGRMEACSRFDPASSSFRRPPILADDTPCKPYNLWPSRP